MRYVIIGGGVAGITAAQSIRKLDSEGDITIITEEPYPFYSRIRLIDYLAGEVDEKGLRLKKDDWYEANRIKQILGARVTLVDAPNKELTLSPDGKMNYDKLLIATGSNCFVPPIQGADKKGVFTLRTLDDAKAIRDYAKNHERVLLIGGGVLGIEAGNALRKTGCSVTVVETFSRLLPRQMDPAGAGILQARLEAMGLEFVLGLKPVEIQGADEANALLLESGKRVECDMIIISAGVRPNMACARSLGLTSGKGIAVSDSMETSVPDVYAAGDVAEHKGVLYGIWPAAERQGEIAGICMAGGTAVYEGTVMSNRLKVAGVDLISAGDIDADGKCECALRADRERFIYRKLVIKDACVAGAILLGDISDRARILKAIEDKRDISAIKSELLSFELGSL